MPAPLSRDEFEVALRGLSVEYWDKHPFHIRLHAVDSTTAEVRSWVANRWYYQRHLSQKNAAIIANCPLPEVRRRWSNGSCSRMDPGTATAASVTGGR